ncbi:ferric-chelate reductase 1-like isoform X1 [Argopecten irradians]|uniref:ferric-chelate reductase 1-like isoform X1 n=1 Tax=Argopecten irradians TaxID=31199 RepID=UPI00371F4A41
MTGDVKIHFGGRKCLLPIFLVTIFVCAVRGFIYGAPPDSCGNPVTFHTEALNETHVGQFLAQNASTSQYKLVVEKLLYRNRTIGKRKQSDIIRVTLKAAPGDFFRGFFIQATRDNYPLDSQDRPAYGTFRPVDSNSQPRLCRAAVGQVGGITHTGNSNKTEVSVDFILPVGCNLGDIQFVATVVKTYSQYWVDVRSDPVSPAGFQGQRSLLCRLYYDPFNQRLQQQVLQVLRRLQMANVRQPAQPGRPGTPMVGQGLQQG